MSFHRINHNSKTGKRRISSDAGTLRLLTSKSHLKITRLCCGRAVLRTFRKASLTVEAAVVLPLFLVGMITLIGIMDVCCIQIEQSALLAQRAKILSMYAYSVQDYYEDNMVDLYKTHTCKLPVSLIPVSGIPISLRARVHAWTGRGEAGQTGGNGNDPLEYELVYVTENGKVYHTSSECTYLDLSIYEVNASELDRQRNDYGGRYHSCEKCGSGTIEADTFYVTEKGDKYHVSLSCSGLTRIVKLVKKSEVGDAHICSRCEDK